MSLNISMVLLDTDSALPVADIARELRNRNPELAATVTADEGSTASFDLAEATLTLGAMPGPVPWSDLEGPCSTSILWKDAAEHVRPHRAHIIVTVLSKLSPVEEAIVLTKCTAAVLAVCQTSIGVYWGGTQRW